MYSTAVVITHTTIYIEFIIITRVVIMAHTIPCMHVRHSQIIHADTPIQINVTELHTCNKEMKCTKFNTHTICIIHVCDIQVREY